jgi:hypothetical protein
MRRIHVHALCLAAATLSLTAVADAATIVGAAAGSLNPLPYPGTSQTVDTTNGGVRNTAVDNPGAGFKWVMSLPMSTTGAKTPTFYFNQTNLSPVETSYCKGHRVNSSGAIVLSSSAATMTVLNNPSLTLSSLTLAANETYMFACYIGGGVQVYSVSYTP